MLTSKPSKAWRRKAFSYTRLIHIYTSTLLFGLLVFFCVTGITLNHRWYGHEDSVSIQEIDLSEDLIVDWKISGIKDWYPDISEISNFIRVNYELPQAHSVDIDKEVGEILLDYKVPAGFATVTIVAPERLMIIEREKGSTIGVLNDLHKGRHSGQFWFWLIDLSAVLMTIFGITGMIILFQGKKNRCSGLILFIAGAISPWVFVLLFVPNLGG